MNQAESIEKQLFSLSEGEAKRKILSSFFKTGKGEYGEGDKFIGVSVPLQRQLIKQIENIPLSEIKQLLQSPYHECRMTALLILIKQFRKAKSEQEQNQIYDFYIANVSYINNWDLVDLSAPSIVGGYLLNKNRTILYQYAKNENLWIQRIAIVSTLTFIKQNDFESTFRIAEILLHHKHDLIHKAVGWMLREVGKKNYKKEFSFLQKHYKTMPRTMLRYAIERFDSDIRQQFLKGEIYS